MKKNTHCLLLIQICLPVLFCFFSTVDVLGQSRLETIKAKPGCTASFAVFIDRESFDACRQEVLEYKKVLEQEGLGTYIISAGWNTPEEVKKQIAKLAARKPALEGMVFIGDIPIARIRKGQHMTTAFKMNESTFPMTESSVTSDRFYDCPSLEFEYIGKDSINARFFYYNVKSDGAQYLFPAYYSARILVPEELVQASGKDTYELLKGFLRKTVQAHQEQNALDKIIYFAGHGYNSDCLTAWRQQPLAFKTYFPEAFKTAPGNRFLNFRQDPKMKFALFSQMQQPDTDVFLFYEHGAPQTQYINGTYPSRSLKNNVEELKRDLRSTYARIKPEKRAAFVKDVCAHFGLSEQMFTPQGLEQYRVKDSAARADVNISLEDLSQLKTGSRVTIFNACYNGSFHEPGYVAGYHIFNDGKTVVTQGNTVNVLQDKWAEQLIGLLSLGARAGFWQKEVATLESHMIGDPTFRFCLPQDFAADALAPGKSGGKEAEVSTLDVKAINFVLASKTGNKNYWTKVLEENQETLSNKRAGAYAPLLRALAIKQLLKCYLFENRAVLPVEDKTPFINKMLEIYNSDKNEVVRLQALTALTYCSDSNLTSAVLAGLHDPYELIRRQSAHLAGKIGDAVFIPELLNILENALEVQRVLYAAESALRCLNVEYEIPGAPAPAGMVFGRPGPITMLDINGKNAKNEIRGMRNYPAHWQVDHLLSILNDPDVEIEKRVMLCEALGWFNHSVYRPQLIENIANALAADLSAGKVAAKKPQPVRGFAPLPAELKEEMKKTLKRLQFSF